MVSVVTLETIPRCKGTNAHDICKIDEEFKYMVGETNIMKSAMNGLIQNPNIQNQIRENSWGLQSFN